MQQLQNIQLSSDSNMLMNPGMLSTPIDAGSLRRAVLFECFNYSKVSARYILGTYFIQHLLGFDIFNRKSNQRVVQTQVQVWNV